MPAVALRSGDSRDSRILTGQTLSASERLARIERERAAFGIRQVDLAEAAGLSERTYRRLIDGASPPRLDVVERLARQLARLAAKAPAPKLDETLARVSYRACLGAVAPFYGVDVDAVVAETTAEALRRTVDGRWSASPAALARQAAIYLMNTAIGIQQRRLAELLGLTPAAICLAIRDVEDRREDTRLDRVLDAAERLLGGRM